MPKKTEKVVVAKLQKVVEEVKRQGLLPLSLSFAQEDLNKVVEKINEIIVTLNSVV